MEKHQKVAVALSGGPDSMLLTWFLLQCKLRYMPSPSIINTDQNQVEKLCLYMNE